MKHTMLIRSCISQLGTRARAGPWGLAPTPCPSLPRPAPTPPPRWPPRLLGSLRLCAPLAFALLSPMELIPAPLVASAQVWQRTKVAAGSRVNSRGGTQRVQRETRGKLGERGEVRGWKSQEAWHPGFDSTALRHVCNRWRAPRAGTERNKISW